MPQSAKVDLVRERVREAMMDLIVERSYEETTAEMVVERAGVERADFEQHFADLEDCYLKVYKENTAAFDGAVLSAFNRPDVWRDRLRAAAYAAARFIRDHPREISFGVTEMFRAGPMAQVLREQQLQRMVDLIDAGRQELDDPDSMTRETAEAVVGAIYHRLIKELQRGAGGTPSAESFVPELMYVAVQPYLGKAVANEELHRGPEDAARYERDGL